MSTNSFITVINEIGEIEQVRYDAFVALLFKQQPSHLMKLHAALGVCGESGELAEAVKKEVIYGKVLDKKNLIEELGDLRFYMEAIMNLYGIYDQEILQANANKLVIRYKGLVYSNEAAIARADKDIESNTRKDYE